MAFARSRRLTPSLAELTFWIGRLLRIRLSQREVRNFGWFGEGWSQLQIGSGHKRVQRWPAMIKQTYREGKVCEEETGAFVSPSSFDDWRDSYQRALSRGPRVSSGYSYMLDEWNTRLVAGGPQLTAGSRGKGGHLPLCKRFLTHPAAWRVRGRLRHSPLDVLAMHCSTLHQISCAAGKYAGHVRRLFGRSQQTVPSGSSLVENLCTSQLEL